MPEKAELQMAQYQITMKKLHHVTQTIVRKQGIILPNDVQAKENSCLQDFMPSYTKNT